MSCRFRADKNNSLLWTLKISDQIRQKSDQIRQKKFPITERVGVDVSKIILEEKVHTVHRKSSSWIRFCPKPLPLSCEPRMISNLQVGGACFSPVKTHERHITNQRMLVFLLWANSEHSPTAMRWKKTTRIFATPLNKVAVSIALMPEIAQQGICKLSLWALEINYTLNIRDTQTRRFAILHKMWSQLTVLIKFTLLTRNQSNVQTYLVLWQTYWCEKSS